MSCVCGRLLLLLPLGDLLEGLGEGVDDYVGVAGTEALDGVLGGLVGGLGGIVDGVPEADADAIGREVGADALTDGAGLREGEGREG
jgi:hypothetical protein